MNTFSPNDPLSEASSPSNALVGLAGEASSTWVSATRVLVGSNSRRRNRSTVFPIMYRKLSPNTCLPVLSTPCQNPSPPTAVVQVVFPAGGVPSACSTDPVSWVPPKMTLFTVSSRTW